MLKQHRWVLLCVLSLAMLGYLGCAPLPTSNTSLGELEVKVDISDVSATPSDGKALLLLRFYENNTAVQLSGSPSLSCDGVTLTYQLNSYNARIPIKAAGQKHECVIEHEGNQAQFSIVIPERPVISSPTLGETLSRESPLTIKYSAGNGDGMLGSASDGTNAVSGSEKPDNGEYVGLDVSTLQPGTGSVGLIRKVVSQLSGTGVRAVELTYNCGADVKVTWK